MPDATARAVGPVSGSVLRCCAAARAGRDIVVRRLARRLGRSSSAYDR